VISLVYSAEQQQYGSSMHATVLFFFICIPIKHRTRYISIILTKTYRLSELLERTQGTDD